MANLKINDLHATGSQMHDLTNDELKNIVGGKIESHIRLQIHLCPGGDPPVWPPPPSRYSGSY